MKQRKTKNGESSERKKEEWKHFIKEKSDNINRE